MRKKRIVKYCIVCNKEFEVPPSWNKFKCCSRKCRDISMRGRPSWNKDNHTPTNTGRTWFKKGVCFSKETIEKSAKTRTGKVYHLRANGRIKTTKGYIGIYIPSHPFASHKHRYYPEHRLVVEKEIGRYLKPKERVHHLNKIKSDNRPENLMAFISDTFHRKFECGKKVPLNTIIFDGRKYKG